MLFWRVKLIEEKENHSDDCLFILKFTHIFTGKIKQYNLTVQDVMQRDYNKKDFDKNIFTNGKNTNISKER